MALRILHISTRLILGGSQENTVLSCEGQARLGHDVHLAFGPIYGPEGSLLERVEKFRTGDGRGIERHVVPSLVRAVHPWYDWRSLGQLRALIGELKPDIVHTHSSKAGVVGRGAAWSVLKKTKRPMGVVHTIHGPPFYDGQNRLVRGVYVASERWAAKRCHLILSVANAMTSKYLAEGIGRPEQYRTVYSGMEVERYVAEDPYGSVRRAARRDAGLGDGDFVIGTVARLSAQKGHDDLLDALGDELKKRPSWKLLWVGDGWLKDRLYQRLDAMGVRGQVVTTGLVPSERVPFFIRAMDVLAHPSYREGLPRTVPQALLGRVCPVAYDVDGTGEACIEGETGKLVRLGDRSGLRDAVVWLHDHPAERAAMAERGRSMCLNRFSAPTMVAELEKEYARALGMARGSRSPG
ncbi:MAG TPA: glycosyltransferase family 4 protein [Phycisphaerales bacterium]|nr:glycosyltransferase family 4 protein [Phycisphaerales bacterium]